MLTAQHPNAETHPNKPSNAQPLSTDDVKTTTIITETVVAGPATPPQQRPLFGSVYSRSSFASFISHHDDFGPRRQIDSPLGRGPVSSPLLMGRRKNNAAARAAAAANAAAAKAAPPRTPPPPPATRANATPDAAVSVTEEPSQRRTHVSTPVSRTPLEDESPPKGALGEDEEEENNAPSVPVVTRDVVDSIGWPTPPATTATRASVVDAGFVPATTTAGIEKDVDRQFRELVGGGDDAEEEESLSDIGGGAEEERLSDSDDFLTDSQLPTADGEDAVGLDGEKLLRLLARVDSETRQEKDNRDDNDHHHAPTELEAEKYLSGSFEIEELPTGDDSADDENARLQRDAATVLATDVVLEVGKQHDSAEVLQPAEVVELPEIAPTTASASFREADQAFLLEEQTASMSSWLDDVAECEVLTVEVEEQYPMAGHGDSLLEADEAVSRDENIGSSASWQDDAAECEVSAVEVEDHYAMLSHGGKGLEDFDQGDAAFNRDADDYAQDQPESHGEAYVSYSDEEEQAEERVDEAEDENENENENEEEGDLDVEGSLPGSPNSSTSSFSCSRRNTVLFVGEGSQEAIAVAAAAGAASAKAISPATTRPVSATVDALDARESRSMPSDHGHQPPVRPTKTPATAPTQQALQSTPAVLTLETLLSRYSATLKKHTDIHPRLLNTYLAAHETRRSEASLMSPRSPRNNSNISSLRANGAAAAVGGLTAVQVFDVCRAIERQLSNVRALKALETEAARLIVEADERNKTEFESRMDELKHMHAKLDAAEKRIAVEETQLKRQNVDLNSMRTLRERLAADVEEAKAQAAAAEVAKGDVVMVPVTGGFATTAFFAGIFFAVVGAMMMWKDPMQGEFVPV
ncbi:hypothetical protein BDZ88DRAFT_140754 [Geranomyces variabilis]|nr:hypothetical protein BDZ88DRAFT_140754 [Geranomyces variabilis]KAJ3143482.1 hypothetical protein HDU90_000243 [Geranomyces variabilis]